MPFWKSARIYLMLRQISNAKRDLFIKHCIQTGIVNKAKKKLQFIFRTSDGQPETNSGWVKDPQDTDDSSSASVSSESRSVKSDSEDADALIDSSDDEFTQVRQMRSQTCPNLSDSITSSLAQDDVRFLINAELIYFQGPLFNGSFSSRCYRPRE